MEPTTREELLSRFTIADYAIFIAMLGVSAFIGVYYACTGGKHKTTKDFFMGGQKMGVFPVAMSILASFMSAIPMLGIPAETYLTGTQFWMVVVAYCFMFPTVAYVFMPVFYKLGLSSVYEVSAIFVFLVVFKCTIFKSINSEFWFYKWVVSKIYMAIKSNNGHTLDLLLFIMLNFMFIH